MIDAVVVIPVLLAGLVLGPVIGYLLSSGLRRVDKSWRTGRVLCAAATIVAAPLVVFTRWSLYGTGLDSAVVMSAWCSYCAFAFALRENRAHLSRVVFLLMSVPMAAGILTGLVLSTVGVLGLMLVGGNLSQVSERRITALGTCRFEPVGGASSNTNSVYFSVLYRPALFPVFEKIVYQQRYKDTEYDYERVHCIPVGTNKILVHARRTTGVVEERLVTVEPW